MSQEYYIVCHKCEKKVHVGSVGMSGLSFWSKEKITMDNLRKLLSNCIFHFEKLGFVWEQSEADEDYEEIT